MSEALYRKYRPQIFDQVVGQDHIEQTVRNAITRDKVSHAYLFCGPRGVGKTTTARLLAKALLCEHGPTAQPDGTCDMCRLVAEGQHPDVYELDAASRTGVDNVREEIIGRVQYAPIRGRYKVYIIDEVHMLSAAAFGALLKTLEEPPSHVVFILCTTDPQKLPDTILSRCQRFDFKRIAPESIASHLAQVCQSENVSFEQEALDLLAQHAEGGMRDALTTLEQLISFTGGQITLSAAEEMLGAVASDDLARIVRAIGARDAKECFLWTAHFVETGADLMVFTKSLAKHVRNLYVMSLTDANVALDLREEERSQLCSELPLFGPDRLARLMGVLGDLIGELKTSTDARLSFEIALTRMIRPDSDLTLEALAERIEAIERGYSAVAPGSLSAVDQALAAATPLAPAAPAASVLPAAAPVTAATPGTPAAPAAAPVAAAASAATASVTAAVEPEAPRNAASAPAAVAIAAPPAAIKPAPAATPAAAPAPAATSAALAADATPAAAPSAASAAGSAHPLSNNATLQRSWQSTLALFKKNKPSYGILFMNTQVSFDPKDECLKIIFPDDASFAFKASQRDEVKKALADALAVTCRQQIPFLFLQESAGQKSAPQMQPAANPAAARQAAPSAANPAAARQAAPSEAKPAQSVSLPDRKPPEHHRSAPQQSAGEYPPPTYDYHAPSYAFEPPAYEFSIPTSEYEAPSETISQNRHEGPRASAPSNTPATPAAPAVPAGSATTPSPTPAASAVSAGSAPAPSPTPAAPRSKAEPATNNAPAQEPTLDQIESMLSDAFGENILLEPLD